MFMSTQSEPEPESEALAAQARQELVSTLARGAGSAQSKVVELRSLLTERFPGAHQAARLDDRERLRTGVPCLDDRAETALIRGRTTELIAGGGAGGSSLVVATLLRTLAEERQHVALIDGGDGFDPRAAGQAACRFLLWVRAQTAAEALKAADLILRDGNIRVVLLDLVMMALDPPQQRQLRRVPGSSWYRLRLLAEESGAVFLVLSPEPLVSSAQLRLELTGGLRLPDLAERESDLLSGLKVTVRRRQAEFFTPAGEQARDEEEENRRTG